MAEVSKRPLISAEKVKSLKHRFSELMRQPPPTPVRQAHTKQSLVTELVSEIEALQKRGYSFEHIAHEITKATGSTFTSQALNTYVKRSRAEATPPRGRSRPAPASASTATPLVTGKPAAPRRTQTKAVQDPKAGTFVPPDDNV